MKFRFGMQARFLLVMASALLVVLMVLLLLLQRQSAMQREIEVLSHEVIHNLFEESLRVRGESMTRQLAGSLANPLYYSDLDAIGAIVRNTARQPIVGYVVIYDAKGRIIHDGSVEIPEYGRPMNDPLAPGAVGSEQLLMQRSADFLDISEPIRIGSERIGGVRTGISLKTVHDYEQRASDLMQARLGEVGVRHLGWMAMLVCLLIGVAVWSVWYMQRTLVRPIRWLAAAAQRIEAGDYDIEQCSSTRQDEVGELVRSFGRMSASIARHDREVRHMAYTDALTGLTNRLAFRESLDHRLMPPRSAGRQLALLFADIDDFKRINDTLGHEAGDEVLLQFANRIREAVERLGGDDALLARFGGDEFVILIQEGSVREAAACLAERLVAELGQPLVVHGRQVFLGTSIGITMYPEDAADASALMKNGDIAMYQAKVAGKNCYRFYSRAMDHAVERRVHLEQELRGAWERNELSLVYQPVFRATDGQMVGAEALLRWQHPVLGTVAPSVFIDVAEQSGLIESLGPHVLRGACAQAMRWTEYRGGDLMFVSVNVSSRQLRNGNLPQQVAGCLRDTGLPASRLHLELTETAVIGDEQLATSLLARLHSTGVKVWLDDFGTGFSGLSHLRQVPVDGVKIDRSFIADLQRNPDDLALTTSIIALAHSLGITVVAEGIEKQVQFELLRARGCDLVQGYWLSQPLTANEFIRLLSQQVRVPVS